MKINPINNNYATFKSDNKNTEQSQIQQKPQNKRENIKKIGNVVLFGILAFGSSRMLSKEFTKAPKGLITAFCTLMSAGFVFAMSKWDNINNQWSEHLGNILPKRKK